MPLPPISDSTLGSRFWLVTDFTNPALDPANPPAANAPGAADVQFAGNVHDSAATSFAADGGDPMVQSAISRANLFAASHVVTEKYRENEEARMRLAKDVLLGDTAEAFLDDAVQSYNARFGVDGRAFCAKALDKLMASDEFYRRALKEGDRKAGGCLGEAGRAALRNAVMGLADMLRCGRIGEDAVLVLANGDYYDASNRADLLRLASESAKKVKELFVGKARFDALVKQCEDALRRMVDEGKGTAGERSAARVKIARLRELAKAAMELRERATGVVKTDYLISDPSGRVKSDRKFQKAQLDAIRDSLRAFRYDIDKCRGMIGFDMTTLRRKCDDMRSNIGVGQRITQEQYDEMKAADERFNDLLGEVQRDVFEGARLADLGEKDEYSNASGEVQWADKMRIDDCATAATKLSHLTNDRIRYHFSGAEKAKAAHVGKIARELGSIASEGGSRKVTLKMKASALFGLDIGVLEADVEAGVEVEVSAQIKVDRRDGTVSVTYSVGGGLAAKAKAGFGVDPDEKGAQGFGGEANASAKANVVRSVTKTYASLDELARTMSRLNIMMTPRPIEAVFAWGAAALRGGVGLVRNAITFLGFRIHRSRMDEAAYGMELRNRNVFGPLGGVFLKKRNVEILSEQTRLSLGVKGGVEAEAGLYHDAGGDKPASNLKGEASLKGGYSREVSAKGRMYSSFAKSLSFCTVNYLRNAIAEESAGRDDRWTSGLLRLVPGGIAGDAVRIGDSFAKLTTVLAELEDSAIAADDGRKDDAFWTEFAAKCRLLALATALLTKLANALDGAENVKAAAKAAGEYIVPRLVNPVVHVPEKIYRERFFDVADVAAPRKSRVEVTFSVSFKAGEALIDKKVGDVAGMALPAQGVDIAKPIAGIATGFVQKDVVGAEGAYQVKYVRESVVSAHKDPRPWMNTGGSHLDFRLHANLSIRMIVEWAFLRHLKEASGLTGATEEEREALKSKWWEEFKDGFTDGMFTGTADAVVEVVPEIFDLPIAEACRKSPVLGRVIGGAEFLKKMVEDETYSFEDATFKTIRLNFADDGRYTGFSLSEDYDTEAKIEGKVLPFLKLGVSLESNTSVTDWEVKTYMSPNSMMKAAADYNDAGNPEGFANYVLRNKKSVLRLVRSGAENPADRPDDRHWQTDCQKTNGAINKCLASLAAVCAREGVAGEQARAMRDGFMELVRQMREQRNLTEAQELDLAQRFYTAAAKIYTLDAMSAPPLER